MKQQFVTRHECTKALKNILATSEERQASRHFKNHIPRLAWTFSLVPKASAPDEKLLDIGSKLDILEIFREMHGYSHIAGSVYAPGNRSFREDVPERENTTVYHFDGERALIACEPGAYHAVTCFEVIEHMTSDPMALVGNINRAMSLGGSLVLSTVNCASMASIKKILQGHNPFLYSHFNLNLSANRHNKEYTTRELMRTVRAGGFEIEKVQTPYVFSAEDKVFEEQIKAIGGDTKFLGDDTIILARKISNEIVRFPSHLYVGGDDKRTVSSDNVFVEAQEVSGDMKKLRKHA